MKYVLAAAVGSTLIGCGTAARMLIVHPPGNPDVTLNIALVKNDRAKTMELRLNDTTVGSASIDSFKIGEQIKGYYRGHTVATQMHTITSFVTREYITSCTIMYDGAAMGEIEWERTKF